VGGLLLIGLKHDSKDALKKADVRGLNLVNPTFVLVIIDYRIGEGFVYGTRLIGEKIALA
jgi:hypothetical protein